MEQVSCCPLCFNICVLNNFLIKENKVIHICDLCYKEIMEKQKKEANYAEK